MPKTSARKIILHLNFKRKNNIKRKRLKVWQIFIEKKQFSVVIKELKLFDHEFFFKHIATRHFNFSQCCFTVFILFNNLDHSAISLANNTIEYFTPLWIWINSKTEKNFPVHGNISEVDTRFYCSKRKNSQFVRINLLVVNLLKGKFYWPNLCHFGFETQSLTST